MTSVPLICFSAIEEFAKSKCKDNRRSFVALLLKMTVFCEWEL